MESDEENELEDLRRNTKAIMEGRVYQSRYPSAHVGPLQDTYGINVIVNLCGYCTYQSRLRQETQCIQYPIIDYSIPDDTTFGDLVETLFDLYQHGKIILIHCQGGRGRSTIVSACLYARIASVSGRVALEHVRNCMRPMRVPETSTQVWFIEHFCRRRRRQQEQEEVVGSPLPPPDAN